MPAVVAKIGGGGMQKVIKSHPQRQTRIGIEPGTMVLEENFSISVIGIDLLSGQRTLYEFSNESYKTPIRPEEKGRARGGVGKFTYSTQVLEVGIPKGVGLNACTKKTTKTLPVAYVPMSCT